MKTIFKRGILILLLIAAVGITAHELQDIFFNFTGSEPQLLKAFYLEDKDSVDMAVIGSSDIKLGYSAPLVYKETGITSYPYCFSTNPVTLWKYELADIERYQHPSVVVVEINGSVYLEDSHIHSKGCVYKLAQCMPVSMNKYHMVREQSPEGDSFISNFFPFVRYHGEWSQALSNDYYKERLMIKKRGHCILKGAETPLDVREIEKDGEYPVDDLTADLHPDGEAALREFLEICRSSDIPNILFVQYPQLLVTEKGYERHKRCNRAGEIIREYGFEYIDLNAIEDKTGIDQNSDFYDAGHLNVNGQKKISLYLGNLVKENYGLQPSELTEKQQKNWAETVKYIDNFYRYHEDFRKENGTDVSSSTPNLRESVKYVKLLKDYQ